MKKIEFFNRYTGRVESESIYGEKSLRWIYTHPLGRLTLWGFFKRALFSYFYGWWTRRSWTRKEAQRFIKKYQIKMEDFQKAPETFSSFNDFFIRELKPGARPIAQETNTIVFPADGRHRGFASSLETSSFSIKNVSFNLKSLLRDDALAEEFTGGSMLFSRLCPVDYHRYHFPVAGKIVAMKLINGPLKSVSPIALSKNPAIFWQNKRMVTQIESSEWGKVLVLEIGATCVGSIVQLRKVGDVVEKGEEKGYFQFGGSAMITLFKPNQVNLSEDLLLQTREGRELYAHMGDVAGRAK